MSARDKAETAWAMRQAEIDCEDAGLPVRCCGEWPECSHMLEALEARSGGAEGDTQA